MTRLPDKLRYATFVAQETSRILFEGAVPADVTTMLATVEEEDDWTRGWRDLACAEEERARAAQSCELEVTARQIYLRAAYYHRLSHYFLMRDCEHKARSASDASRCYRAGISLPGPRVEVVAVPYGGRHATGYLHLPTGRTCPPCVVCIPGLGHTKESMHNWCVEGVQRGLAVFVGDGPGYGETRVLKGERLGAAAFDEYLDGVVAVLSQDKRLDGERVGILGDCFGGLLALRAVARSRKFWLS